jgi:hypothetical protein
MGSLQAACGTLRNAAPSAGGALVHAGCGFVDFRDYTDWTVLTLSSPSLLAPQGSRRARNLSKTAKAAFIDALIWSRISTGLLAGRGVGREAHTPKPDVDQHRVE